MKRRWRVALALGGVVYPLAGNWVQGGGWLGALGRNLALGHGFVDAGGAGTVFLLAAAFALAAVAVWPAPKPEDRAAPARRGRPPKPRTATEARPSFGLDPETHALFKIWLLRRGISMQDYLEDHNKGTSHICQLELWKVRIDSEW